MITFNHWLIQQSITDKGLWCINISTPIVFPGDISLSIMISSYCLYNNLTLQKSETSLLLQQGMATYANWCNYHKKIYKYITSVDLNSFKAGLWLEKVTEVGMCCLRKINLPPFNIWYLHNLTHLFLIVGSERWLGLHNHYTPEWSMILVWEVTNQYLNLQLVTTCSGVLTQRRNIKLLRGYSTVSLVTKNAFVYYLKLRTFFKVGVLYVYCWLAFTLIHFRFNQLKSKVIFQKEQQVYHNNHHKKTTTQTQKPNKKTNTNTHEIPF